VGYQLRQGHSTQAEAEPFPEPSFVTSAHPLYAIVQPRTVSASTPDDSDDTSLIPTRSVSTPSSTRHPRRDISHLDAFHSAFAVIKAILEHPRYAEHAKINQDVEEKLKQDAAAKAAVARKGKSKGKKTQGKLQ
jgi:hypothetical protein